MPSSLFFIGLMSGTSLDGVDAVLATVSPDSETEIIHTVASAYLPFSDSLRSEFMRLQAPGENELHRESMAANELAMHYATCIKHLLENAGVSASLVRAIGAHGQTVRHRPDAGYTRQTNNPSLLAELTGIDVIADFRSRDIAAGGQGAPLVPAFHHAIFGSPKCCRVVVNIGGIANISILRENGETLGFDTGPGNVLMDAWIGQTQGKTYDAHGAWAAQGNMIPELLSLMMEESFFAAKPPKSTGRDLFHREWLGDKLASFQDADPKDVQATLAELTARTISEAIAKYAPDAQEVYVCGGGAYNHHLLQQLDAALHKHFQKIMCHSTDNLGVSPTHVEALAFAWLAYRHVIKAPANLPAVTGASGLRILGACYPA